MQCCHPLLLLLPFSLSTYAVTLPTFYVSDEGCWSLVWQEVCLTRWTHKACLFVLFLSCSAAKILVPHMQTNVEELTGRTRIFQPFFIKRLLVPFPLLFRWSTVSTSFRYRIVAITHDAPGKGVTKPHTDLCKRLKSWAPRELVRTGVPPRPAPGHLALNASYTRPVRICLSDSTSMKEN